MRLIRGWHLVQLQQCRPACVWWLLSNDSLQLHISGISGKYVQTPAARWLSPKGKAPDKQTERAAWRNFLEFLKTVSCKISRGFAQSNFIYCELIPLLPRQMLGKMDFGMGGSGHEDPSLF